MPINYRELNFPLNVDTWSCPVYISNGQKYSRSKIPFEHLLFWDPESVFNWYIGFLWAQVQNFEENIQNNPTRYQWLVNCIVCSFSHLGHSNWAIEKKRFHALHDSIRRDLYGYLWDYPEVLEKDWKAINISIQKLIKRCKEFQINERIRRTWGEFHTKLITLLDEENIDTKLLQNSQVEHYLQVRYAKWKNPEQAKLMTLGISREVITAISKLWTYQNLFELLHADEPLIASTWKYYLYELQHMVHLEEEWSFNHHCIWESGHYWKKMKDWEVRVFSLRKDIGERYTIEYDIEKEIILQIEGKVHYTASHEIERIERPSGEEFVMMLNMLHKQWLTFHNNDEQDDLHDVYLSGPIFDELCITRSHDLEAPYTLYPNTAIKEIRITQAEVVIWEMILPPDVTKEDVEYIEKTTTKVSLYEEVLWERFDEICWYFQSAKCEIYINSHKENITFPNLSTVFKIHITNSIPFYADFPQLVEAQDEITMLITCRRLSLPLLTKALFIVIEKGWEVYAPHIPDDKIEYTAVIE